MKGRTFKVVLIKPSHYDDDGYVIQWRRSIVPSNSLACLYGVMATCAEKRVLGDDVDLDIDACDETNTVVDVRRIARSIRAAAGGFVGLVGVQSNQFPRALDLTRQFRAAGIPVVIGGFHVSGCLAMLPEMPADLREALDLGASLFAGEAEGRIEQVVRDAFAGTLKPIYNQLNELPQLDGAELPILPKQVVSRVMTDFTSFDAGRGCPFQCSFCTIINVQGRKSRFRTADDVERILRENAAQGITNFFVTDDNFARNRNWESILDRIIALREQEGFRPSLIFQVDTLCHRIPGFIEKVARAGCIGVFIGLESINPESLMGAKKRQNKIWAYREMLLAWRNAGVVTCVGYILGFPTDTPETIARDIDIIKKELPVDIMEFFLLTPLPGSEDHRNLAQRGVPMDPDMNKYDLEHVCTAHGTMTKQAWEQVYRDAWARYYTDDHVRTVFRRGVASGLKSRRKLIDDLTLFSGAMRIEGVHPLQFGVFRRKVRLQRRHGMPIVNPFSFYLWRGIEIATVAVRWIKHVRHYRRMAAQIMNDPANKHYVDEALRSTPDESAQPAELVQVFAGKIPKTHGVAREFLVTQ
jgi:radical SAM superfamily enzyme YgiQ (UPF0313 family)